MARSALPGPPARAAADWRRNLAALWLAEFTAIFGFSFAFPFLPVFLHRDLGIQGDRELAFWTGIAAGVTGFSLAIASPIWGRLADRYGRRLMLLRAMLGGGVTVGLMGLAQNALQLTALRILQGAASGTVAAATALVASETPPQHVGWSLGVLSSAIALGGAAGPAVGGIAGNAFGLRAVFLGGGALLLLATLPVLLVVREDSVRRVKRDRPALETLRAARPGTLGALGVLIAGQALLQSSYTASQQLVVLRLVQLDPRAASTLTGIAFGLAGVATAAAGVSYSRALRLGGYRRLVIGSALGMAAFVVGAAAAPSIAGIVASFVFASFVYGALIPALSSMIGLEAPTAVQATVFGVSASAIAVGFGVGPLMGGFVASRFGIPAGLYLAAVAAAGVAVILARGREPAPARTPTARNS